MTNRLIMIDLDNTLCDAAWRDHLAGAGDWDAYHAEAANDAPMEDICTLLRTLNSAAEYTLCIMSERPEKWRQLTIKWLADHLIWADELLLRPNGNKMKVTELKVWFAEETQIDKVPIKSKLSLVIDDNEKVIDAFNAIGIPGLHYRGRVNRAQG